MDPRVASLPLQRSSPIRFSSEASNPRPTHVSAAVHVVRVRSDQKPVAHGQCSNFHKGGEHIADLSLAWARLSITQWAPSIALAFTLSMPQA